MKKFVADCPLADPDAAARKIVEIANAAAQVPANGRSLSYCNYAPLIHRQPETDQDRPVNTLRNPDARAAISLPVEVFWFEPMLERVSAGHTELLLHWRRTHRGPEQKA
jgi:hypothetical protein